MKLALTLAAALLIGPAVFDNDPTFHQELQLTRDRPRQLTNDGLIEYHQRAQVDRHDKTITVTTWNPVNTKPDVYHYEERSISIDASGWKELMVVIQEAIGEE